MGPTGTPTEIPAGETVVLAGGGLGNAVLFSIGKALPRGAATSVLYFAGYKKRERPLQGRRDRGGGRRRHLVRRRGAGLHAAPAAGPRLRRQHRPGDARLRAGRAGRAADPAAATADRIIAIGSRPHDGGGAARAPRRARSRTSSRTTSRIGVDQLADAVHDEGDLRAVPAAPRRSGDRQGDGRLLLLQPGPGARPRRLRQNLRQRLRQNTVQEKIGALWIDRSLRRLGAR